MHACKNKGAPVQYCVCIMWQVVLHRKGALLICGQHSCCQGPFVINKGLFYNLRPCVARMLATINGLKGHCAPCNPCQSCRFLHWALLRPAEASSSSWKMGSEASHVCTNSWASVTWSYPFSICLSWLPQWIEDHAPAASFITAKRWYVYTNASCWLCW